MTGHESDEINNRLTKIEVTLAVMHKESTDAHERINRICNTIKNWLQGAVVALIGLCGVLLGNMFF